MNRKLNEKQALYLIITSIMSQSQDTKTVLKNSYTFLEKVTNNFKFSNYMYCSDLNLFMSIMNQRPTLHRFPNKMAKFLYLAFWHIHENYRGSALNVFLDNIGNKLPKDQIINHLCSFKGIANHKAEITYFVLTTFLDETIDSTDFEKISISCISIENSILDEIDYLVKLNER